MLETKNWYVGTQIYAVLVSIRFSTKNASILLRSAFFCNEPAFFLQKYYLYSKQQYQSCVTDSAVLFLVFLTQKVTLKEDLILAGHASGKFLNSESGILWILYGAFRSSFGIAPNQQYIAKSDNDVTYNIIITIFFVKFSSWFKIHINIITGAKLSI